MIRLKPIGVRNKKRYYNIIIKDLVVGKLYKECKNQTVYRGFIGNCSPVRFSLEAREVLNQLLDDAVHEAERGLLCARF
jgi:hypothetical protein